MKYFLFLIFTIAPLFIFGQIWYSADVLFSPEQAYRSLSPEDSPIVELRNEVETKKFGYRYGLNLNIYVGKSLALKTGLRMVESGYGSKTSGVSYDYKLLEIPLALRYYYGEQDLRFFTEVGIGFNYFRSGLESPVFEVRKWSNSAMVSVGFDADFSEDLTVFLQPIFRYHLSETVVDAPIEEHLYSIGVELGLRFKF